MCGLAGGLLAISVLWFVSVRQYTAVALLKIISSAEQIPVFHCYQQASFEIYKGTQQQLLTSDYVLTAALRDAKVASLAMVLKEEDPVRWLAKSLHVEFPGNAEVMKVSLVGERPDDVAVLVNAVVDAYMKEVVNAEGDRKKERLNEINKLYAEKEAEIRTRRIKLNGLAEKLGTDDTGALALKQQITLQQFNEARNDLARLRAELQRAQDDLQIKEAWDVEAVIAPDPKLAPLLQEIDKIDIQLAELRVKLKEPQFTKMAVELLRRRKTLVDQAEKRREELLARLQSKTPDKTQVKSPVKTPDKSPADLDPQIAELKARIDILTAQEKAAVKNLEERRQKAERIGNSSTDLEMMRSELQYLEKILPPIADEREKLKDELESTPRITVLQRAEAPKSPVGLVVFPDIDSKTRQWMLVALIVLAAILLPAGLVLWWTGREQRLTA